MSWQGDATGTLVSKSDRVAREELAWQPNHPGRAGRTRVEPACVNTGGLFADSNRRVGDRAGRPSRHHHAHGIRAVRSKRTLVPRAPGPIEGAGLRPGQRARVHAGREQWLARPPRIGDSNTASPSPTTTRCKMIEQVKAFHASKVGAVVAAPVDPASLEPQPPGQSSGRAPMSARSCRRRPPPCSTPRNI